MLRKILLVFLLFLSIIFLAQPLEAKAAGVKAETITVDEMYNRLKATDKNKLEDLLYIKFEDEVYVFQDLFQQSKRKRKKLIAAFPHSEALRVYTSSKASFAQFRRMLLDYEERNINFDGYSVITEDNDPEKLEGDITVYRLWFMKIDRYRMRLRGAPVGIAFGWGWWGPGWWDHGWHHGHGHGGGRPGGPGPRR